MTREERIDEIIRQWKERQHLPEIMRAHCRAAREYREEQAWALLLEHVDRYPEPD